MNISPMMYLEMYQLRIISKKTLLEQISRIQSLDSMIYIEMYNLKVISKEELCDFISIDYEEEQKKIKEEK